MQAQPVLTRAQAALLFEDFSPPPPPPAPVVALPPPITEDDLRAARDESYAAGLRDGAQAAAETQAEAVARALAGIDAALQGAAEAAAAAADAGAQDLARLLMAVLAKSFPALCARHGPAEAAALAAELLPKLSRDPALTVRVAPDLVAATEAALAALDPEGAERVSVAPGKKLPPGDARIEWRQGSATRDMPGLWKAIARALASHGLLEAPDEPVTGTGAA